MYPVPENPAKSALKVTMLVALIAVLWFVGVWTGAIRCSLLPGGCPVYWGLLRSGTGGKPEILIVHGEEDDPGLGDPKLLEKALSDPNILAVHPDAVKVERVTKDFLKGYDLVIVTKAKVIPTKKVKEFIDFAAEGGRLVWTGDAGTALGGDESPGEALLLKSQRPGEEDVNEVIGPWARRDGEYMVPLDEFIAAEFLGTYCELKNCRDANQLMGLLEALPGRKHPLVEGIRDDLEFYGDFALVNQREGNNAKRVLTLKYGSELVTKDKRKLGKEFPVIISSGLGTGKVVYYEFGTVFQ